MSFAHSWETEGFVEIGLSWMDVLGSPTRFFWKPVSFFLNAFGLPELEKREYFCILRFSEAVRRENVCIFLSSEAVVVMRALSLFVCHEGLVVVGGNKEFIPATLGFLFCTSLLEMRWRDESMLHFSVLIRNFEFILMQEAK